MEDDAEVRDVAWLVSDLRGKDMHCADGPVGQVADVLVDPATDCPSHLIWREAVVVTKEVSIPISYIERVESGQIVLGVDRKAIERLPRFWTANPDAGIEVSALSGYCGSEL
jgi:hypothetical protein